MMFLSASSWKDRSSNPYQIGATTLTSSWLSYCNNTLLVNGSVGVWMQGLKYNLVGNTIDPISLLIKRFHIAHVHERQRHLDKQLPIYSCSQTCCVLQMTEASLNILIALIAVQFGACALGCRTSFKRAGHWQRVDECKPKPITGRTVLSSFCATLNRS